ncbi:8832_t:CDS:1, partial [Ambispora gerdemannii]
AEIIKTTRRLYKITRFVSLPAFANISISHLEKINDIQFLKFDPE